LIKRARQKAGLTQEGLGARCNVSQAAVAQWEREDKQVKEETLALVASALNLTLAQLLATDEAVEGAPAPKAGRKKNGHGKRDGTNGRVRGA
jgi:transcriptional regulator with XRE-family HTH domain